MRYYKLCYDRIFQNFGNHKLPCFEANGTFMSYIKGGYLCLSLFYDRFDKLLHLLAQSRPLLEAMEEVGITRDEVVTLQQLKLKMMEKQRQTASNVRFLTFLCALKRSLFC